MAIGRPRSPCGTWCGAASGARCALDQTRERHPIANVQRAHPHPQREAADAPQGDRRLPAQATPSGAACAIEATCRESDGTAPRMGFVSHWRTAFNHTLRIQAAPTFSPSARPCQLVPEKRLDVQTSGRPSRFHAAHDARRSMKVHCASALTATTERPLSVLPRARRMAKLSANIAASHHPTVALRDNDGNVFFAGRLLRCVKKKYQLQQRDSRMTDCYEYVCRFALHRLTRD